MKRKFVNVLIISFVSVFFFVVFAAQFMKNNKKVELPVFEIVLNEYEVSEVVKNSKDAKYYGNLVITTNNGLGDLFSDIELKGRGNSTWGWPKSPFQIKFSQKTDLFGMGESRKWILLANYFDKSNLRNALAFYIEEMLDEEYALKGKFIKLYVNGEYMGIYYLTEKIEIGKDRINLRDPYGVVAEMDNHYAAEDECYWSSEYDCLVLKDAVVDENANVAMTNFVNDFKQLEEAAKEGNYERAMGLGDMDSFAIYFLLSEFTMNPDACSSSFYFYKDGDGDLIHVGPGWDFDLAMGNRFWGIGYGEDDYLPEKASAIEMHAFGGEEYDEETGELIKDPASNLLFNLLQIPEFREKVVEIYEERMMSKEKEVLKFLAKQAFYNAEAAIEDRATWREYEEVILQAARLGEDKKSIQEFTHGNLSAEGAYWADVVYLLDWTNKRFEFMNKTYTNNAS